MIDLERALDLDQPDAGEFLEGIQGNILTGHGRSIAGFAERVTTAGAARRGPGTTPVVRGNRSRCSCCRPPATGFSASPTSNFPPRPTGF
jgi:hypothetical protein